MCGIAGFVLPSGPGLPPRETRLDWLSRMTRAMAHRGPDGEGLHLDGPAALGHRRLSIIDLAAGGQPMQDADQRAAITFNGEIYNYRELKPRFEQRGFAFRTQSDTEAILAAWLTMGAAGLDLLEGMFAFALWDRSSQTLFAARDRFGKKPFFYTLQNGVFAFASELTALTQLPFLRFETPLRTLGRFVAYEYVPTPETIYKDVYQLRPGHYLLFRDGAVTEAPYWDMPMPGPAPKADETELCEELRRLLGQAVKRRLVSDVPLGVFLSGGIDFLHRGRAHGRPNLPRQDLQHRLFGGLLRRIALLPSWWPTATPPTTTSASCRPTPAAPCCPKSSPASTSPWPIRPSCPPLCSPRSPGKR